MPARKILLAAFMLLTGLTVRSNAQCSFDPTITGDTLLCPNSTGLLTTQVYDTYQWYSRPMFSGSWTLIPGATSQTYTVDASTDAGNYFKVEVSLNGCAEFSPEVLVDGWVFLLPFTIIEGDYTIGLNGEIVLCQGDTVILICGSPYDTNIQWFDNGNPVAGANNDTLIVTGAGSYTFSGAPSLCPNYIQNQFIPVDVMVITCPTGLDETPGYNVSIFPNPSADRVSVTIPNCERIEVFDSAGRQVLATTTHPNRSEHEVIVSGLPIGMYVVKAYTREGTKSALLFRK